MKAEITMQKLNMKLAINWLDIIEVCEKNIARGWEVDYYKQTKMEAAAKYADCMATVVKDAIEISQANILKVA